MQISIILLGKLINFFIMILLGFILVNKNILKSSDSRILFYHRGIPGDALCHNWFIWDWILPKEKLQGRYFPAVIAVIIHVLLLIFINIGRKFWHWTPVECATVMYSNSGNMIIPLVSAILGSDYVLYSCAFMSVQLIFLWTHCSTMLSEKPHLEWKKIISNINVLAIIAGLRYFSAR